MDWYYLVILFGLVTACTLYIYFNLETGMHTYFKLQFCHFLDPKIIFILQKSIFGV